MGQRLTPSQGEKSRCFLGPGQRDPTGKQCHGPQGEAAKEGKIQRRQRSAGLVALVFLSWPGVLQERVQANASQIAQECLSIPRALWGEQVKPRHRVCDAVPPETVCPESQHKRIISFGNTCSEYLLSKLHRIEMQPLKQRECVNVNEMRLVLATGGTNLNPCFQAHPCCRRKWNRPGEWSGAPPSIISDLRAPCQDSAKPYGIQKMGISWGRGEAYGKGGRGLRRNCTRDRLAFPEEVCFTVRHWGRNMLFGTKRTSVIVRFHTSNSVPKGWATPKPDPTYTESPDTRWVQTGKGTQESWPSWVLSKTSDRRNLIACLKTCTMCFASMILLLFLWEVKKKVYT